MYWMSKHSYLDICVTFADNFFFFYKAANYYKQQTEKKDKILVQGFVYKWTHQNVQRKYCDAQWQKCSVTGWKGCYSLGDKQPSTWKDHIACQWYIISKIVIKIHGLITIIVISY